jgi:hypothetical protein
VVRLPRTFPSDATGPDERGIIESIFSPAEKENAQVAKAVARPSPTVLNWWPVN